MWVTATSNEKESTRTIQTHAKADKFLCPKENHLDYKQQLL